jgi:hypothetical protein
VSWEAVTWASKQKLKKSYEQIVLLVLANCADPNGEAFVKWPGRDHWWIYLSERTRLPKSSLFRHLNTLVALGLGERTMQVMADGSRRPTFKLDMTTSFDIDLAEDQDRYIAATAKGSHESQSPRETEHDDAFDGDENDSDISHSQEPETEPASQSPVGTVNPQSQSPVGTDPFPVLRLQEDSLLVPKDSPLPPSGGLRVPDQLWEEFVKAWGEPIPKMQLARSCWDHTETAKRAEIVAAAKGYWTWLRVHPKPPSAQSAQSFIRDAAGWAQWLRYAPDGESGKPASVTIGYPLTGPEGRALVVLHDIANVGDFLRGVMTRNGAVNYPLPVTPRLLALANAPPKTDWVTLDRNQAGAWEAVLSDAITVQVRSRMREGSRAPWPWPPRKDGTLSASPDDPTMNNEDLDALASEGQR